MRECLINARKIAKNGFEIIFGFINKRKNGFEVIISLLLEFIKPDRSLVKLTIKLFTNNRLPLDDYPQFILDSLNHYLEIIRVARGLFDFIFHLFLHYPH